MQEFNVTLCITIGSDEGEMQKSMVMPYLPRVGDILHLNGLDPCGYCVERFGWLEPEIEGEVHPPGGALYYVDITDRAGGEIPLSSEPLLLSLGWRRL